MHKITKVLRSPFRYAKLALTKYLAWNGYALVKYDDKVTLQKFLRYRSLQKQIYLPLGAAFEESKSQFGQDLVVLCLLGMKKNGFFVEFGAVNGLHNSNTWMLETQFGWDGIVSEPSRRWHNDLKRNRRCKIDLRCVWIETGKTITFGDTGDWMGGNTITLFSDSDGNNRKFTDIYEVETVSLDDLLDSHEAPSYIDFLSIDTEGSEFEILKSFDFSRYGFGIVLVEHNHTEPKRGSIRELLVDNGYYQVLYDDAQVDDWFVSPEINNVFQNICCAMCNN